MMLKNNVGLYIHIPFCESICSYCAFSKLLYNDKFTKAYLFCLENELKKYKDYRFSSIYIGGGTPSSLNEDELKLLFSIINPYFDNNYHITIEVNPNITLEKLNILKDNNVSRISIGIQTFNPRLQKLINRNHKFEDIISLINTINNIGINDINVDLMYGIIDETYEELQEDLDKFISLNITHISTYCLQIEENTVFYNKKYKEMDEDLLSDQYNLIVSFLKKYGFNRYEVSNFSKDGYESKHNLLYWNNKEYIGIGLGASSYDNHIRRTNTKNFNKYLKCEFDDYEEVLDINDEEFYYIMLGLRKERGFSLIEFKELFKVDFLNKYESKLIKLHDNLIIDDYVRVKPELIYILDFILKELLFD